MPSPPPFLNLLVIRSPDIERAAAFYARLGIVLKLEQHDQGPPHYASCVNGFVLEIYPLQPGGQPTTSVRLGFSVVAVDDAVKQLRATGVTIVSEPTDSPWGRRAVVRDFDGHTVELVTPLDSER